MPLKPLKPGTRVKLTDNNAVDDREPRSEEAEQQLAPLLERLPALQTALYAESKQALLVVLQGRDASGKDGLTRKVFGPLNSQGCHEQDGQECPADHPCHRVSQTEVGIFDAKRNKIGADQGDADDDETAGQNEW